MDRIRHIVHNSQALLVILSLYLFDNGVLVRAQNQGDDGDMVFNFQPSLAVVIGLLSIMFSATFVLLIFLMFCHRGRWSSSDNNNNALRRSGRFSGIDKTVIESLPFFRFSSLQGSRSGLECSVCLSKFEDTEILRLLPKCKHAFHVDCIDHWLERHSTCPLCRHRISPDDVITSAYSNSMRLPGSSRSERIQDLNGPEIFIEREEEGANGSSTRLSVLGSSFRKFFKGSNIQEEGNQKMFHKFNHRIVVSDVMFQNRWSNVSSSDLMFLNSEMVSALSSDRFSALELGEGNLIVTERMADHDQIGKIKEEMDRKRQLKSKVSSINATDLISSGPSSGNRLNQTDGLKITQEVDKRSQSEITSVSRLGDLNGQSGRYCRGNGKEERRRQLWLPIARRTVQWFANREERPPTHHEEPLTINTSRLPDSTLSVNPPTLHFHIKQ